MNMLEKLTDLVVDAYGKQAAVSLNTCPDKPGWEGTVWDAKGFALIRSWGKDRGEAMLALRREVMAKLYQYGSAEDE